jgi:hypothetical protein
VHRSAFVLALCATCVGCATISESGNVRVHHYLFGLAGGAAVDVRDVCASGKAESLAIRRGFAEYALSILTLGLYLPHDVRIRCTRVNRP